MPAMWIFEVLKIGWKLLRDSKAPAANILIVLLGMGAVAYLLDIRVEAKHQVGMEAIWKNTSGVTDLSRAQGALSLDIAVIKTSIENIDKNVDRLYRMHRRNNPGR